VRLLAVDRGGRDAALAGRLGDLGEPGHLSAAPGWPHEDSAPGLSFLDSGGLAFLVIDDDGRVAGEGGTKAAPDADGMVEIGYGLAPASRGRGLGSAAVAALLAVLASDTAVHCVEAEVHVGNEASWRVLARHGFTPLGPPRHGYQRYRLVRVPPR
jgi:RimJ/RimL family protein N-acetyltransferase